MIPNEKRKRKICFMFVFLVIISIIVIITLIIIVTLLSQRSLIDEYLVRVSFSKLQSITDAVAMLKKNDLQEIFRELLILDAVVAIPFANQLFFSSYIRNYDASGNLIDPQTNSTVGRDNLISSSDVTSTLLGKTTYYIYPEEMNYAKLNSDYPPAGTELDYCAIFHYYSKELFSTDIIDTNKDLIYLAFNSELFCHYPDIPKSYHNGSPSSTTRVGYNFETNSAVYQPTMRSWYEAGVEESGLTNIIPTYVFSGNGIGATLSKAFQDDLDTTYGVIAYDVLPYKDVDEKDEQITKLLFDNNDDNYQYLLLDQSKVVEGNEDVEQIVNDLVSMVYSSEDSEGLSMEIQEDLEIKTFTDVRGKSNSYISYYVSGDKKYLFLSDLSLLGIRSDGSSVLESVNKLGFTGSSASLEGDLEETINDLILNFVLVNLLIGLVCIFISLVISIIASRHLADNIMDVIINMSIRMTIALAGQLKAKRLLDSGEDVAFAESTNFILNQPQEVVYSEFQQLILKVENGLKVVRLKDFQLKENNSRQYNHTALLKYEEILNLYKKAEEDAVSDQSITMSQTLLLRAKYKQAQRKWYNNMGCINHVLKDYSEARDWFEKACVPEDAEEAEVKGQLYENSNDASNANMDKATWNLNYAVNLVEWADYMKQGHITEQVRNETEQLYSSAEKKIKESKKGFSSMSNLNEVEILWVIMSLRIYIALKSYFEWKAEFVNMKALMHRVSQTYNTANKNTLSKSTMS